MEVDVNYDPDATETLRRRDFWLKEYELNK